MSSAVERLRMVAGEAFRAEKWQTAKKVARAYVETMTADLDELAAGEAFEVDAAVELLGSAAGCREMAKLIKRQVAAARRAKAAPRGRQEGQRVPLSDLLPDTAPGELGRLVMPSGYLMLSDGVAGPPKPDSDERPLVSARPVYLAATVRSVTDGEYYADVVWQTPDGQWEVGTFPRHVLADARSLVKLARRGLPVDSGTAGALVRYLTAFERANVSTSVDMATNALGWQGERGRLGFMWGETCIGGTGGVRLLAESGKAQLAEAYRAAGSLEEWRRMVWEPVQEHPRVALGVYAAVAPVVLGLVRSAPGFVVDWAGRSTGGKTTTLRVAASVWGDPAQLIKSWSATANAIEHLASFSAYLPTMLDDTKEARQYPSRVIGAVYQVTGLQSKLRASPDGLRTTSAFRTVLLSTGEAPITSFGADTGAAARVLAVRGFPFSSEDSRAVADGLNAATLTTFGHVGPAVVRWLDANRERWPAIESRWAELREGFASEASNPFGGRSAPYVATLQVAAELVSAALGLKVNAAALEQMRRFARESAQVAERHRGALHDLWGWLASRPDARDGLDNGGREVIVKWDNERPAVIAVALRRWLDREGYQTDVIDEWARLGWIDTAGDRRTQVVRFLSSGQRVRCYVFTDDAVKVAGG